MASNKPVKFSMVVHCPLADLQDLWGSLRDGDYWMAVKRAIRILNDCLNPEALRGGTTAAGVSALQPDTAGYDEVCLNLRNWIDNNRVAGNTEVDEDSDADPSPPAIVEMPDKLKASDAPRINIDQVIAIIEMVVSIFERWQKRRQGGV